MKILARGSMNRIKELKEKLLGVACELTCIDDSDLLSANIHEFDLIFDLKFDEKKEQLKYYAGLKNIPVFVCAVKQALDQAVHEYNGKITCHLYGINALHTFLHRSLLEAIAYGFKHHLEIFSQSGIEIKSPKVTNGGSKSKLWREILSDVLNQNLTSIINHPGASFGAAVIAGLGIGLITDWRYVEGSLEQGEIIEPNIDNVQLYMDRYQQYRSLAKETTEVSHSLARSNR
jgi:hypothetical protein